MSKATALSQAGETVVMRAPTPQEDLFLKPGANAPLKMDRVLMEYPFFSIQKRPVRTKTTFKLGDTDITITPSHYGQATYWDLDVLRYAISRLNELIEDKKPISPTIVFVAHDFLKVSSRGSSQRSYDGLREALRRLAGTRIETNIVSGTRRRVNGFGWLTDYELLGDDDGHGGIKRLKGVSITLNDWLFDAIAHDRRVLSYAPEYFQLTGGLERRLYDIARKFCGSQKSWPVSLAKLHHRVGTAQPLKRFRLELQKIIEADSIPDYRFEILDPRNPDGSERPESAPLPARISNLERLQLRVTRKTMNDKMDDLIRKMDAGDYDQEGEYEDVPFTVIEGEA